MNAIDVIHHFIDVLYHDNVHACDDDYVSDADLNFDLNPDEAIAHGAAIIANALEV